MRFTIPRLVSALLICVIAAVLFVTGTMTGQQPPPATAGLPTAAAAGPGAPAAPATTPAATDNEPVLPGTAGAPDAKPRNLIEGGSILVRWSPERDMAWGYSKSLGKWAKQDMIASPKQGPAPLVSENIAVWPDASTIYAFSGKVGKWAKQEIQPPAADTKGVFVVGELAVWRVDSAYYAFSGTTGTWDVLRLPAGHSPPPVYDIGFFRVQDGDDIYTFSETTGRWSSPKEAEAATASSPDAARVKVFTLKNASAADAERLITRLYGRELDSIAADERTNSLVVRGAEETLNIVYHIVTRLDELGVPSAEPAAAGSERKAAAPSTSIENLAERYQAKDNEAQRLAKQMRELQAAPNEHAGPIKDLSARLSRIVGEAFAARQQLHQAEAAQLQQRLAGIEQTLKTRERLSKEIIDRRVKDLLNPDLQWEQSSPHAPRAEPNPRSTSAARTVRDKQRERWQQIETLFEFGRANPEEMLPAAKDLNQAEVAAAGSADEKREALKGAVERLKRIKSIVDARVAQGAEPGWRKLGVDAEVLKAEAELAAGESSQPPEKNSGEARPQSWPSQPAAQKVILNAGSQTITLRTPDEFRKELREVETAVANIKSIIEELQNQGKTDSREYTSATKNLPSWEHRLAWVREQYAAQIHLLELEVKDAVSAVKAAQKAEESARRIREKNPSGVSLNQVNEAQRALETARLRVERASTLLDLYRKADPQRSEGAAAVEPSSGENKKADLAAAAKVRDKLRQRMEVLDRMFKSGEVNYLEYLRSAVQFDDAEIAAAASAEGRTKATQMKVDHLKQCAESARKMYSAGELNFADLLAYQAELLKAEAELAAASPAAKDSKPSP